LGSLFIIASLNSFLRINLILAGLGILFLVIILIGWTFLIQIERQKESEDDNIWTIFSGPIFSLCITLGISIPIFVQFQLIIMNNNFITLFGSFELLAGISLLISSYFTKNNEYYIKVPTKYIKESLIKALNNNKIESGAQINGPSIEKGYQVIRIEFQNSNIIDIFWKNIQYPKMIGLSSKFKDLPQIKQIITIINSSISNSDPK
jgi:hypothetical protein